MVSSADSDGHRLARRVGRWDGAEALVGALLSLTAIALAYFVARAGRELDMSALDWASPAIIVLLALGLLGGRILWSARPANDPALRREPAQPRRGRDWLGTALGILMYAAGGGVGSFIGHVGYELQLSVWVWAPASSLIAMSLAVIGWHVVDAAGPTDAAAETGPTNQRIADSRKERAVLRDIENRRNRFAGNATALIRDLAWVRDALATLREEDPDYMGETAELIDTHLQSAGRSLRQVAVLMAQIQAGEIAADPIGAPDPAR